MHCLRGVLLVACSVLTGCSMQSSGGAARDTYQIVLPTATAEERSALQPGKKGAPLQVGFGREIPNAQRHLKLRDLHWQKMGDGYVAHISVQSTGASSLRVGMRLNQDVASLECTFVNSATVPAAALLRKAEDAPYWSPVIPSDTITLELKTKTLPDNSVVLELPLVSHIP